jgi:D-threo-aldose 1-dehydrogenase
METVAALHGVDLKAAASQFVVAHPATTWIIPGTRKPERVEENVALVAEPIPAGFWAALKAEGLIPAAAPVPVGEQP